MLGRHENWAFVNNICIDKSSILNIIAQKVRVVLLKDLLVWSLMILFPMWSILMVFDLCLCLMDWRKNFVFSSPIVSQVILAFCRRAESLSFLTFLRTTTNLHSTLILLVPSKYCYGIFAFSKLSKQDVIIVFAVIK